MSWRRVSRSRLLPNQIKDSNAVARSDGPKTHAHLAAGYHGGEVELNTALASGDEARRAAAAVSPLGRSARVAIETHALAGAAAAMTRMGSIRSRGSRPSEERPMSGRRVIDASRHPAKMLSAVRCSRRARVLTREKAVRAGDCPAAMAR